MDLQRKVDKMKAYIYLILNLLISVITVSANAAFTYDPDTRILEDDIWKFEEVTLAKDCVTLGMVKGSMAKKRPETPQPLDFSNIKDTNGKSYNVVTIGGFGGFNVSEVIAPECTGFSGQNCFSGCTSLRKVILNSAFNAFGGARAFSTCTSLEEFEPRTLLVTEVTGSAFASCEKLSGTFYLPNCTLIKTHAFSGCKLLTSVMAPKVTEIQDGAFSGCASMSKIEIISSLGASAFADIAHGAELYMPKRVPETLGSLFTGSLNGPYQKVVLKDNYEDYLDEISENHYVVRREDFNNRDIVFEGKSWEWDLVAEKMSSDTVICTVGTDKTVSLKVRNVLAFIIEKDSAQNKPSNLSCFWVLKAPKIGLSVSVR